MLNLTWQGRLRAYALCVFLSAISFTTCIPFLPVYLLELGAPKENIEIWSALIFSSTYVIGGIMAPVWGRLSDLYGKKCMALRSAGLLCITYVACGMISSHEQLMLIRVVQGFAIGFLPVVLSMISEQAPREDLGSSLGIIQSAQLIGTGLGPIVGGLVADFASLRASFFVAGFELLPAVILIVLMKSDGKSEAQNAAKTSIAGDLAYCVRNFPVLEMMLITLIFNMIMLSMNPMLPLFVSEIAEDGAKIATYTGLVFSLPSFIGAVAAPLWGRLGQRRGFFMAMTLAFAGLGIVVMLQGLSTHMAMLIFCSALTGIFVVGPIPAINAITTMVTPENFKGRAFGAMTLFRQLGVMTGPALSAAVAANMSLRHVFFFAGSLMLLMAVYAGARHLRMRSSDPEGAVKTDAADAGARKTESLS